MPKSVIKKWFAMSAWKKIIIALVAGVTVGLLLGKHAVIFKPIGVLFIHAIHMMVVPVVFTAIVCAVITIHDSERMHQIWIRAIIIYVISMLVAATLGILVASLIAPGSSLNIAKLHLTATAAPAPLSFYNQLINIVPSNPVEAFAQGNILQILVFALILGVSINVTGKKAKPVADLFKTFSHVVFTFAGLIMSCAPYGIFALLAWVFGEFGLAVLLPLLKFVGVVYLGCLLLIVIYYFGVLKLVAKVKPLWFFNGAANAAMVAFTTSSSAATLPTSLRCAKENLKISKGVAGFLLPLGATLNLNGLTIYIVSATIFSANLFGIHLSMSQYVTILITTVLAAIGAASVPGSALIVMGAVMSSVGIPLTAISLIAGVDRLNDMAQTATNVIGDLFATTVVAKSVNAIEPEANEVSDS